MKRCCDLDGVRAGRAFVFLVQKRSDFTVCSKCSEKHRDSLSWYRRYVEGDPEALDAAHDLVEPKTWVLG